MFAITLSDKSEIRLCELIQSKTYAGLLEGTPTTQMNQNKIAHHEQSASQKWGLKPLLIQPEENAIEVENYPFGDPASIPSVTCISLWDTHGQSLGDKYGSYQMAIVWYQEEFALPIEPNVLNQIQDIKLSEFAEFYEW